MRAAALGAVLHCALLAGCGRDAAVTETTEAPPLELAAADVARVEPVPLAAGVRVTGSLDAKEQVQINAKLTGQIETVRADRGQRVAAGDVLAVYDSRSVRAELARARAELASAERDLEAAELLYREGAISERDVVQARVAVESYRSQVTIQDERLRDTEVRAPIAGTVSERHVSSGEAVSAGDHLFTIADTTTLELAGRLPAARVADVKVGQAAELRLTDYPNRAVRGRVTRIESVADPRSRQVSVYIEVDNPGRELVGGLFATGTILPTDAEDELPRVPAVPITAIVGSGANESVYAIVDGVLERRPVETGVRDEQRGVVEVRAGLDVGDVVLVAPPPWLEPGRAVDLVADAGEDAGGDAAGADPAEGGV